jgi:hypothetical protein
MQIQKLHEHCISYMKVLCSGHKSVFEDILKTELMFAAMKFCQCAALEFLQSFSDFYSIEFSQTKFAHFHTILH